MKKKTERGGEGKGEGRKRGEGVFDFFRTHGSLKVVNRDEVSSVLYRDLTKVVTKASFGDVALSRINIATASSLSRHSRMQLKKEKGWRT